MKKKTMKVASTIFATTMIASSLFACSGGGFGGGGNSHKTELKIGVFNGGLGYAWADKLAEKFEEKYKDVSFEPGKTGVDVIIDPQKDLFKVDAIKSAISQNSGANDIYYTCYNFYKEFANSGLVYNMNDIVKEKVYLENGELADMTYNSETHKYELKSGATAPTMSMVDKLKDTWKDAYYYDDNETIEAGYYALPYETSLQGFVYDYDLFEEKGWLDYDGIDGTSATMDDFFDLLDRIDRAKMIPYTYSPANYWAGMRAAYMAQYEGYENAELNYTYSGEYTFKNLPETTQAVFTSAFCKENNITDNGDGTYTITITPSNAWLLAYQPGKDSYVNFIRDLTAPNYFDPNIYKKTYDFDMAQTTFVLSTLGKDGQKRIAMIMEGEWWENEARKNFTTLPGGYGARDFRFMLLPQIENQAADADVHSIGGASIGTDLVINAKTKKLELCKLWMHFSHTESALEEFTLTNGVVRNSFTYDLSTEQQAQLTPFGRNVYKIKMGLDQYSKVQTVYPAAYSDACEFYNATPMGGFSAILSSSILGSYGSWDAIGTYMCGYFIKNDGVHNNSKYVSAAEFIEGVHAYYSKSQWESQYKAWQIQGS